MQVWDVVTTPTSSVGNRVYADSRSTRFGLSSPLTQHLRKSVERFAFWVSLVIQRLLTTAPGWCVGRWGTYRMLFTQNDCL
jgi:hypothetical protein